ncbi:hypothetical protein [Acidisoma cellulosilyticum]|nr:hypothetical protein [Acidisoma cellulosilyticum]
MIRLLILAGVLVSLAACGKVGPNAPPGPASDVIYPRLTYPAQ